MIAEPSMIPAPPAPQAGLESVTEMLVAGGPLMVPIGFCSVVALTYVVERALRLRRAPLGMTEVGEELVPVVRAGGVQRGKELCMSKPSPLARVMQAALEGWGTPPLEREKKVEDAGAREVRRLSANLRPLVVVAAIAPLLGLLGTVWGMISAFSSIASADGLGRPEVLAAGIGQALITTAAGLAIAIPTHAAYFWLKGRIERFARRSEDLYAELIEILSADGEADVANS